MPIDSIDFKNPDTLTKEMGDAVLSTMFGEFDQGEQKAQGEAQPRDQEQEDIPNASIRLDKMRQQRDEERSRAAQLERELAEMRGKLSVLDRVKDSNESSVDPTEYMDDTQRFLYNENQQLKDTIAKLTDAVKGIQTEGTKKKLEEQENRFFENNPQLKENREQFVEDMLGYLKDKPNIKNMLKSGELTLPEVYGMYSAAKPQSTKTTQVSNPDRVFSGNSRPVPPGRTESLDFAQARKKAMQILSDRESTNKRQAVDFLQNDILNDIVSQLEI